MKLHIQSADIRDREELRTLLIDAADELAGSRSRLLEPKLPWDGHPILMADADSRPVLVSFDPDQCQAALLNGLQAAEQLAVALPWINQVYDALQGLQLSPRLVVVSRGFPPGATAVLANCPQLRLYCYKVLKVNDEIGLWLEQLETAPRSRADAPASGEVAKAPASPVRLASDNELPALSEEEAAYFQQL